MNEGREPKEKNPRCTYSPQPSVQIYLGYGHCTPISASVGAPMVLKVVDAKKEKENKNISPKDIAYYRFE